MLRNHTVNDLLHVLEALVEGANIVLRRAAVAATLLY
jgi:hypothetical protein